MGKIIGSVIFPGLGHLLSGRYVKGAVLAVVFSVTLQTLLLSVVWPELFEQTRPIFMGLALIIWGYGILSHWWLLRRTEEGKEQADEMLLAGMKAILRNDLKEAEEAFRAVLRLNDRDVEGWLYLAKTCQLKGEAGRARKFYRVVKRLDRERKWSWEIEGYLRGPGASKSATTP